MAEKELTIAEDSVVTKYKMAGDIVNRKFVSIECSCNKLAFSLFDNDD